LVSSQDASFSDDAELSRAREGVATDRRVKKDRRQKNIPVALERRAGGERRRQIDPTTCERDYNTDEIEFMQAMDQYKRDNRRPFPTWSEVLEVLRALGYRKVAPPTDLPGNRPNPEVVGHGK
jgi:hypothetical protein